jgi:hypothetical protein
MLLYNPHWVVWQLKDKIQAQTFMKLTDRAMDIGAADFDAFRALLGKNAQKGAKCRGNNLRSPQDQTRRQPDA